jgi:hypothetical protein
MTDKTELHKTVGRKILYAWDDDTAYGRYIGTISGTQLGERELQAVLHAK